MTRDRSLWLVLAVIVFAVVARFDSLEASPPGFYVDEAAVATQITCVRQTGADAFGNRLPLFSEILGGGFVTPAYLYPGLFWTSAFGDSIASFRSLAAFFSALSLLGLFYLGKTLFRDPRAGLFAAFAGALSPWGFQFARINWDPAAAPAYLVWACAAYLMARTWKGGLIAGALFAAALYVYPPLRVQSVLVALALFWWKRGERNGKPTALTDATTVLTTALLAAPLIAMTISGELQGRFEFLSIFSKDYLEPLGGFSVPRVTRIFVSNVLSHLSPDYLFLRGDENLRHTTQRFGLLGPVEAAALILSPLALISDGNKSRRALLVCVFCFFAGLVPSALTWESIPHALRSYGAWPFLMLAVGWCLNTLRTRMAWWGHATGWLGIVSLAALMYVHLLVYPKVATDWFDKNVVDRARIIRSAQGWSRFMRTNEEYPLLAKRFYLMSFGKQICLPSPAR